MIRRVRDAVVLNLTVVYGHHLLVGACRLWGSRRNLGPLPEHALDRLAREYARR